MLNPSALYCRTCILSCAHIVARLILLVARKYRLVLFLFRGVRNIQTLALYICDRYFGWCSRDIDRCSCRINDLKLTAGSQSNNDVSSTNMVTGRQAHAHPTLCTFIICSSQTRPPLSRSTWDNSERSVAPPYMGPGQHSVVGILTVVAAVVCCVLIRGFQRLSNTERPSGFLLETSTRRRWSRSSTRNDLSRRYVT